MLTKELSIAGQASLRFIEPMYAEAVRELPDGGLWSDEAKLDGYRCLAAKGSRHCALVAKTDPARSLVMGSHTTFY
jgi:ATP-dependent DNA ligase